MRIYTEITKLSVSFFMILFFLQESKGWKIPHLFNELTGKREELPQEIGGHNASNTRHTVTALEALNPGLASPESKSSHWSPVLSNIINLYIAKKKDKFNNILSENISDVGRPSLSHRFNETEKIKYKKPMGKKLRYFSKAFKRRRKHLKLMPKFVKKTMIRKVHHLNKRDLSGYAFSAGSLDDIIDPFDAERDLLQWEHGKETVVASSNHQGMWRHRQQSDYSYFLPSNKRLRKSHGTVVADHSIGFSGDMFPSHGDLYRKRRAVSSQTSMKQVNVEKSSVYVIFPKKKRQFNMNLLRDRFDSAVSDHGEKYKSSTNSKQHDEKCNTSSRITQYFVEGKYMNLFKPRSTYHTKSHIAHTKSRKKLKERGSMKKFLKPDAIYEEDIIYPNEIGALKIGLNSDDVNQNIAGNSIFKISHKNKRSLFGRTFENPGLEQGDFEKMLTSEESLWPFSFKFDNSNQRRKSQKGERRTRIETNIEGKASDQKFSKPMGKDIRTGKRNPLYGHDYRTFHKHMGSSEELNQNAQPRGRHSENSKTTTHAVKRSSLPQTWQGHMRTKFTGSHENSVAEHHRPGRLMKIKVKSRQSRGKNRRLEHTDLTTESGQMILDNPRSIYITTGPTATFAAHDTVTSATPLSAPSTLYPFVLPSKKQHLSTSYQGGIRCFPLRETNPKLSIFTPKRSCFYTSDAEILSQQTSTLSPLTSSTAHPIKNRGHFSDDVEMHDKIEDNVGDTDILVDGQQQTASQLFWSEFEIIHKEDSLDKHSQGTWQQNVGAMEAAGGFYDGEIKPPSSWSTPWPAWNRIVTEAPDTLSEFYEPIDGGGETEEDAKPKLTGTVELRHNEGEKPRYVVKLPFPANKILPFSIRRLIISRFTDSPQGSPPNPVTPDPGCLSGSKSCRLGGVPKKMPDNQFGEITKNFDIIAEIDPGLTKTKNEGHSTRQFKDIIDFGEPRWAFGSDQEFSPEILPKFVQDRFRDSNRVMSDNLDIFRMRNYTKGPPKGRLNESTQERLKEEFEMLTPTTASPVWVRFKELPSKTPRWLQEVILQFIANSNWNRQRDSSMFGDHKSNSEHGSRSDKDIQQNIQNNHANKKESETASNGQNTFQLDTMFFACCFILMVIIL